VHHETEAAAPFYTPPPPPRAVAVQPAPLNYLVFFDFNKSDLTIDAKGIIKSASDNAAKANPTKITVTGHTDTVGSDAYNMRLSKRRAVAVEKELVHDGVPAGEIAIFAKGKRELLVPTADGVKEPQNRRVQIVFE
jgi:outer membrane protein OmpA-like peptidoglycan-associated protein